MRQKCFDIVSRDNRATVRAMIDNRRSAVMHEAGFLDDDIEVESDVDDIEEMISKR